MEILSLWTAKKFAKAGAAKPACQQLFSESYNKNQRMAANPIFINFMLLPLRNSSLIALLLSSIALGKMLTSNFADQQCLR